MTGRRCTNCAAYRHCLKAAIRGKDAIRQHCHEWKPLPGLDTKEKKPVAGCEYCRPSEALYKAHHGAELHLSTLAGRRTLQSRFYTLTMTGEETTNAARCAEFYINFCPNCGRDLRGD